MLRAIARRKNRPLSRSFLNSTPRLELAHGAVELFYDPETHTDVMAGVATQTVTVDGIRFWSPGALVRWYEMMCERRGLPKDHENLDNAKKLLAATRARELLAEIKQAT